MIRRHSTADFTSDTSLLDALDLLRNDPIGFMEEVREQASLLTSLSERSPGKTGALERGHLVGRHVSVPLLKG